MMDFAFIFIVYILPSAFCGFIFGLATGLCFGRIKQ